MLQDPVADAKDVLTSDEMMALEVMSQFSQVDGISKSVKSDTTQEDGSAKQKPDLTATGRPRRDAKRKRSDDFEYGDKDEIVHEVGSGRHCM